MESSYEHFEQILNTLNQLFNDFTSGFLRIEAGFVCLINEY